MKVASALVLLLALPSTGSLEEELLADFEACSPGELPGKPWRDVRERVAEPTVDGPTARVVETTDARGETTRAVQIHDAIGTSQGVFAGIEAGAGGTLSMNVRIDGFSDARGPRRWPIAIGFTEDASDADLNQDPHVVVYAYHDRRWYLFLHGGGGRPGINLALPAPPIEVGRWYHVSLEGDFATGRFRAEVADAKSWEELGAREFVPADGRERAWGFDAFAIYDGEYGTEGGTRGGCATFDDVRYAEGEGATRDR